MTTKDAQGIAATATGPEVTLPERPEGLMKPKDMSDFEMPRQGIPQAHAEKIRFQFFPEHLA